MTGCETSADAPAVLAKPRRSRHQEPRNPPQDAVLRRAGELYEELQGNPSKTTRVKLDFLESVPARLANKRTPTDV